MMYLIKLQSMEVSKDRQLEFAVVNATTPFRGLKIWIVDRENEYDDRLHICIFKFLIMQLI